MKIIKLKQLHPDAKVPTQATPQSACWDLYAIKDLWVSGNSTVMVYTGWAMQIPEGYCVKIYARSGIASFGTRPANCVGVIDADYRGEIKVLLRNDSNMPYVVGAGDRIAQFMLEAVVPTGLVVVDELDKTARGEGGFGSTGR